MTSTDIPATFLRHGWKPPTTLSRLPGCCRHSIERIPGWSEHVQPLRNKALFWHRHRIRIEYNCPHLGVVADCMRRTQTAYHCAVCQEGQKGEESCVWERIAGYLLIPNDNKRNFWLGIKHIRGNKTAASRVVDGATDASCTLPKYSLLLTAKFTLTCFMTA